MLLTPEERAKFAEWLRVDANSNAKLAEQMEKLPSIGTVMIHRLRALAQAELMVAEDLERPVERMTIG